MAVAPTLLPSPSAVGVLPNTMNEYPPLPDDSGVASRRSEFGTGLSATQSQSQSESDDDDEETLGQNGSRKRKRDGYRGVMNVT